MPQNGTQLEHAEVFWNMPLLSVKSSLQPHRKKINPTLSIVTGKAFMSSYELDIKTLGGILWLEGIYWFYAEVNKEVPKSEGFLHFNRG